MCPFKDIRENCNDTDKISTARMTHINQQITNKLLKHTRKRLHPMDEHLQNGRSPIKRKTFYSVRRFPRNCGPTAIDEHLQNGRSPIKRKMFDSVRSFPRNCGPTATCSLSKLEDLYDTEATGNVAIAAVPLEIVAPEGVHFDFKSTEQYITKQEDVQFDVSKNEINGVLNDSEVEDCVIIEKKDYKYGANGTSLNGQSPFSGKFKPESSLEFDEESDVHILSPSEWEVSRLVSIRKEGSDNDIGIEAERATQQKLQGECSHVKVENVDSERNNFDSNVKVKKLKDLEDLSIVCYGGESGLSESRQQVLNACKHDIGIEAERATQQKLQGECSHVKKVENVDSERNNFDSNVKVKKLKDLEDLSIVCYGGESGLSESRQQVLNACKLFEEMCQTLLQEIVAELKGGSCHVYDRAAILMKNQNKCVNTNPRAGHVSGVEIGDQFGYRGELIVVGLHHERMCGINSMMINGKKCAVSIVDSGRYENKTISTDSFVYSGHGGNEKVHKKAEVQKKKAHQELKSGNLALKNSMDEKCPVRVIRKHGPKGKHIYVYEGLYTVRNFWLDDQSAYMFEMVRLPVQPGIAHHCSQQTVKNEQKLSKGYLVHPLDDLSSGKEKIPIRVVNEVNDEKPPQFTYITEMKYPDLRHIPSPSGCDCINGCSDNDLCCCGLKNGGELPFNEEGRIVKVRNICFHECGPSCNCPPSCQNRVSQHGIRYRLEVFKTKSTGWGVRSCDAIPSGGFICEYIGELLQDNEAEKRINDDEYLFDLDKKDGFTIDAFKYGNVGRFINHSCSPNLYAQKILYDCADERTPHIMFFATEDIPPLRELSYDYNYSIGRVCDEYGNIKIKSCHCGSRKCTRRMY